jgi:hypothetical protein
MPNQGQVAERDSRATWSPSGKGQVRLCGGPARYDADFHAVQWHATNLYTNKHELGRAMAWVSQASITGIFAWT